MPDPKLSIVESLLVDIRPEFYHIPVKPILPSLSMFFVFPHNLVAINATTTNRNVFDLTPYKNRAA